MRNCDMSVTYRIAKYTLMREAFVACNCGTPLGMRSTRLKPLRVGMLTPIAPIPADNGNGESRRRGAPSFDVLG
ncbi:protein of unknown function [Bradyrhizobium sp. ORS 285]|nr:protein of unknown function [Bradyrhizobium sp. ORS 285]